MPRVPQREQYKRHLFLGMMWHDSRCRSCLAELSPNDQWMIHVYYQPSKELGFRAFKEHLRQTHRTHPELCHVAGKLYQRICAKVMQQVRLLDTQQEIKETSAPSERAPRKKYTRALANSLNWYW